MLCIKAAPWLCTLPAGRRSPNYEVYIQKSFCGLWRSINKYTTSFAPWVTHPLKSFSAPLFVLASPYGRVFKTSLLLFWPKMEPIFLLLLINFILKFKVNKSWTASNKLKLKEDDMRCDSRTALVPFHYQLMWLFSFAKSFKYYIRKILFFWSCYAPLLTYLLVHLFLYFASSWGVEDGFFLHFKFYFTLFLYLF